MGAHETRNALGAVSSLGLALLGVAAAAAGAPEPYAPDAPTYLLMHFDGDLRVQGSDSNAQAEAFGGAAMATNGWAGACLAPGTGGVRVAMTRPYEPPYGRITLEARVFLREYPKTRGCVIDKLYAKGTNVGAALFLDSAGRLGHEVRSSRGGARRAFLAPEGTAVPLNRWTHVMVVNAPWPLNKFQMYVDRVRVLDQIAEHPHGLFRQGDREAGGGVVIIGNSETGDAPFPGLIDEARIYAEYIELTPRADVSWTDPEARRPRLAGVPYFLPRTRPLAYVSCDAADAGEEPTGRVTVACRNVTAVPGVRGGALSGGEITLGADPLLTGREGSIEFWMMPENWSSEDSRGMPFLRGAPLSATLYVFNSAHDDRPLAFFFKDDDGQNAFVRFLRPLLPEDWYHFVITWREGTFRIYCNGEPVADARPPGVQGFLRGVFKSFAFPGAVPRAGQPKRTRFDEIYLYPTALAPQEAWNAYARYRCPERLVRDPIPYAVSVKAYPGLDQIHAEADFLDEPPPARLVLACGAAAGECAPGMTNRAALTVSTAALPVGDHRAEVRFLAVDGTLLYRFTQPFARRIYPWLHNPLGVPTRVPPPWVPLTVEGRRIKGLLTKYTFGEGLLVQSLTLGRPLLAAPADVTAWVHGASPVTLTNTGPRVERLAEGLGAKVRFTLAGSGVAVDGTAEVDFDGFIKYALTPRPIAGAVVLDRLRVRLPLRPDEATDFYVLGDHLDHFVAPVATHAGVFWDSLTGKLTRRRELPEYGAWARGPADRPYNFLPFAWLGNHRRGLCFMADDDRPWVLGPPQPALAFENGRVAGQPAVSLCLNLIAAPVTLAPAGPPRTFVFGLMATPSKPPPAGWRQARSKSFYVKSQAGRVMGSSMFAAPYPADFALSKAYTDALWAEGSVPLPYLDYLSADFRMEPVPDFRWEWFPSIRVSDTSALDRTGVPEYGTGSLTDWYLFKFNEWSDRCGVNGFYVDCVHPRRWPDLSTGQDHADGYRLFAMRELFKRLYCLQMAKGRTPPFLIVHMTHTMIGPAMSFADLALEGEDFYHVPDGKDHMDCWPNEHLAIVDNPALWGVGVQWLDRRGDRSGYRIWVTQLLLHDNVRWNAGPPVEAVNAFTATPPEPEFALYRDNRAITAEPAGDIRISYYRKPGEVLAIVGNHAREARVIVLHADLAALALKPPAAWADAETGELLGAGDRRLALTVPPRDCRLLRIQADRAP